MNAVSELARRNLGVIVAWGIALALFTFGTALHPEFAAPNHVRTLLLTASFIGFAGVGQTLCILTGAWNRVCLLRAQDGTRILLSLADPQVLRDSLERAR